MEYVNGVLIVVLGVIVLILKHSMKGYGEEKGKLQAALEELPKLTQKVEEVKKKIEVSNAEEIAKIVKGVEARYELKNHYSKEVFNKEYEVLENVYGSTWKLQACVQTIMPVLDKLPVDKEERKKVFQERWSRYAEAFNEFRDGVTQKRPFIPGDVVGIVDDIWKVVRKEHCRVEDTYHNFLADHRIQKSGVNALDHQEELDELIEKLQEGIRDWCNKQKGPDTEPEPSDE
ncbi:hypothetical protein BVY04_05475 [bacterium M21]|nr:hypothetical protein BVY04_05475 [bacterium M21]